MREFVSMYKPLTCGFVKKLGTDSRACLRAIVFSRVCGTALQSVPNFFTVHCGVHNSCFRCDRSLTAFAREHRSEKIFRSDLPTLEYEL